MHGYLAIRELIAEAKGGDGRRTDGGGLTWDMIAERTTNFPGAPLMDAERCRKLGIRTAKMPDDGFELRGLLAGCGIPILKAYRASGHFPDFAWGGLSSIQRLEQVAEAAGIPIRVEHNDGARAVVRFV